ncbi:CheY-like receiver, AAA-type ATPase and DNA-binding domain-containing response regulator [Desulfocapsa sulfexigens DSM 10523]|uniref:CheY-like receiver, AAA-type ATPase and DNA-binding domain-containing response regulator n=1 Tax=Desulfocapsa sulfexigens (strain DSM 10523 / SB164P1) TaxID=1167006 RepID=M1PAJ8_DESSD|nr:sigma-54 dependent transcriptional regulator [Desulfocapsa sulfexigens]AGF78677.1 CheY-like receiver, AAA-type ATPase and DNA-binding domain-containing response regulator [Desulfocapsa sulfexigens DSM 10523]
MLILIVDDEITQREMLQGFLEKQGFKVLTAAGGNEALRIFESAPVELVLMDHRMEDMNGDEVLERMRGASPLVRAIMITAYGDVSTAVKVMQLGADDFMEKPVDLMDLLAKIRRIEQGLMVERESGKITESLEQIELPISIIGSSKPMQELLSLIYRVAPTEWAALIHGETGTGKELVARLIHLMGPRKNGPFVEVNCAAIPENLFESELFGHEKGAFTGAASQRRGRFELAAGGTLFLDEVGELPLQLQAKLLRALQEKKVSRVGSEKEIEVDARVLTATNKDLQQMVSEGSFREDLFFRLNVLELRVPPLRERRDDIVELTEYFLGKYAVSDIGFGTDAMAQLVKYPFPGNVRELEHLIQRLVTLVRGSRIEVMDLPMRVREGKNTGGLLSERLAEVEKEMLIAALEEHQWVQTKAADSLGISERVLRYKMNKAGIKK